LLPCHAAEEGCERKASTDQRLRPPRAA
jgi:hypothetical protein